MSRSEPVEHALLRARADNPMHAESDFHTLAAEVQRLEGLLARLDAAEARVKRLESAQGDWVRGLKCPKCAGTGENDDARTCSACAGTGDVWMTWQARAEAAEAQNTRLRDLLFKFRGAAHHAEIWLTSCLECKEWMWSEHQHEAATEARDDLKAALADDGKAAP